MFKPLEYPEIKKLFIDLLDLTEESGRGALLVATAHVDDHLTKLIEEILPNDLSKTHKEKLFKYPGQLSSFSSKIELAYVFRLINKTLYDSLNALRKLRNDAAHSPSKFELHELNHKLRLIYELSPGFSNHIKEISSRALIDHKTTVVKDALKDVELSEEDKKKIFDQTFQDKEKIALMGKQVPFWELAFGLCFLCGLIVYHKEKIRELTIDMSVLSNLVKDEE